MTRSEIETLFKTYYAKMYRVARAILYDEDTAKDVVSDVFATLINNQTVLQADTVEHYLMSSTRNRCLNVIAHKKIKEKLVHLYTDKDCLIVSGFGGGSSIDQELQYQELMRYVENNLPPMDRNIFRLRYLQEMTFDEMAKALCISRQSIHTHLKQSIEKIRAFFTSNI